MLYFAIFLFILMLFVLNSIDWYQYFNNKISEYGYKISIEVRESEYKKIMLIVFGLGFSFGVLISILIFY
jgi:hypothetical protein